MHNWGAVLLQIGVMPLGVASGAPLDSGGAHAEPLLFTADDLKLLLESVPNYGGF